MHCTCLVTCRGKQRERAPSQSFHFDNAELPAHPESIHHIAKACWEAVAVLASNPLTTHHVLDPTFAYV